MKFENMRAKNRGNTSTLYRPPKEIQAEAWLPDDDGKFNQLKHKFGESYEGKNVGARRSESLQIKKSPTSCMILLRIGIYVLNKASQLSQKSTR
ncbi:hypothetical protein PCANC_13104 [Puccinia coronata f. sp. avenae]|uniref:Uncharacterized protein n=1 Tax=Puccinia coronata f. sp. avenae TaxID=200324 RepID=A0A2N5UUS2_9BASI|nr:hypothetical protein PCANC_13104 [Puccinia coronata f. sp. avenae]